MKGTVMWIFVTVVLAGQVIAAETPDIWAAAAKGDLDGIKQQLAKGTNVNATFVQAGVPGSGATPLHLAAATGQLEAAKLLLEKGAEIEAKAADEYKGTPLHWAAFVARLDAVKFLIDAGANVNAKDQKGNTPLDAAINETIPSKDRPAVVKLLRVTWPGSDRPRSRPVCSLHAAESLLRLLRSRPGSSFLPSRS